MDSINIGFSKPKNKLFPIFSWLIRLIDKTPYSHVYVSWYSASIERSIVYEAGGSMVHFVGSKRFQEKAEIINEFEIECTTSQKLEIMKFAVDNAEIPYGIIQVFGIGLVRLAAVFGLNLSKNPLSRGDEEQVCSELGGRALQILNIEVDKDLDIVTPRNIFEALAEHPKAKQTK